ncbi:UNVERIFIED_CONTAM: hypothetical protein GTU68_023901 [Idotea baltica]|nr:hypothetical protein [Idotea baltica]
MARTLVTGGAGFIGSHLCDRLVEAGDEVICLDNFFTGRRANIEKHVRSGAVEVVRHDITEPILPKALKEFAPEIVFHFAAQVNVRRSVDDPVYDATSNLLGTVAILEASREVGVKHLIFSSTGGAIYGEQDYFPADEAHPTRPKCPYGVSKLAAEEYLAYYGRFTKLATTALRLANVYGPRQNPKGEAGVVAVFTDRLLSGDSMKVNGDGKQTRDFVYVGDVVAAAIAVSEREATGFDIFNVGRGNEISVNDVVVAMKKVFSDIAGRDDLEAGSGPALQGEQMRSVISPQKLSSTLGWKPKMDFEAGLATTVKSFLDSAKS